DPRGRLKQGGVEVWRGDAGEPREPSSKTPPALPGDSRHERVALTEKEGEASGELTLPPLPSGKVYWVQPTWVNGNGETHWASATVHTPEPAVERRPATLVLHHEQANRPLQLSSKSTFKARDPEGEEHDVDVSLV